MEFEKNIDIIYNENVIKCQDIERKIEKAYSQLIKLTNEVQRLGEQYKRAKSLGKKSQCFSLKMSLTTVIHVQRAYCCYVAKKMSELQRIKLKEASMFIEV